MTFEEEVENTNVVSAFISMPMAGKTKEQIITEFRRLREEVIKLCPDAVCPLTYITQDPPQDCDIKDGGVGIWYLAQSLEIMAGCQAIYVAPGWQNAIGCKLEMAVAREYGLVDLNNNSDYFRRIPDAEQM